MISAIRHLCMVMAFLWFTEGPASSQLSISQIAEKYTPSVVTIVTFGQKGEPVSSGSGFFLGDHGLIATSHHVLVGSSKAIIRTIQDEESELIEITHDDPKLDLTIGATSLKKGPPLILGDSEKIQVNEPIVAIGNAPGWRGILSTGFVSGIRKAEDIQLLQMTAPVSPGCSGGPVLNLKGEVIGIATAFIESQNDLGFAMPVNYLRTLKSARMKLADLPGMSTAFKAKMEHRAVTDVLLIRNQERLPSSGSLKNTKGNEESPGTTSLSPDGPPGMVFFKNGRKLLCDRAWKEGKTVFLVMHGKGYAVGYDESQIDMEKSFI